MTYLFCFSNVNGTLEVGALWFFIKQIFFQKSDYLSYLSATNCLGIVSRRQGTSSLRKTWREPALAVGPGRYDSLTSAICTVLFRTQWLRSSNPSRISTRNVRENRLNLTGYFQQNRLYFKSTTARFSFVRICRLRSFSSGSLWIVLSLSLETAALRTSSMVKALK